MIDLTIRQRPHLGLLFQQTVIRVVPYTPLTSGLAFVHTKGISLKEIFHIWLNPGRAAVESLVD
jgi:hypothetical protein